MCSNIKHINASWKTIWLQDIWDHRSISLASGFHSAPLDASLIKITPGMLLLGVETPPTKVL